MNILPSNSTVRFSDIHRTATDVQQELNGESPDKAAVDFWADGKSSGYGAYALDERMKSLAARAGKFAPNQDPSATDLEASMADKIETRSKIAKYATYAVVAGVIGLAGAALIQLTGTADLGVIGSTLANHLEMFAPVLGGAATAIKLGHSASTKTLKEDQRYLATLACLVQLNRENTAVA